ncbi:TPA: deoxyribonuclease IV [Candidatus Dojkabacteria bacterium]|uniref:Deoxyribonuclease IV n=1 Tax=Candidatus Dojkabacteria bacterium TaxID=2099670 RepID=A0A832QCH4_9BACT|nr:deoxyribonuclease IV [Candidatus Dojkabacteria bacterium]
MYLGIHVSSSGGIENSIKNGEKYGVNSIQMMPTTPMKWATKLIPDEDITAFLDELEKSSIKKVLVHGIYLTNLAREDKKLFHLGKMGLVVYLDFAEKVAKGIKARKIDSEVLGVCFHPGSQKELSYEDSLERISYGMQWVLDEVKGTQKLLIETTAGTGTNFGRNFTELKLIKEGVKDSQRVGFVVDTQHTFAGGYDWVNDMTGVVEEMDRVVGIENVKAIHLNDSMVECGSNKDRHANLGKGKLGEKTISHILHEPKFKNIPFILETPALKSNATIPAEVEKLKELAS